MKLNEYYVNGRKIRAKNIENAIRAYRGNRVKFKILYRNEESWSEDRTSITYNVTIGFAPDCLGGIPAKEYSVLVIREPDVIDNSYFLNS